MYAAIGTRPDISYAVGLLSSYNTKDLKLVYTTGKRDHGLYGFVDSDWAKSQDRKSIGG